jgi:tRNA (cytosine49-C5)-methyltransferase
MKKPLAQLPNNFLQKLHKLYPQRYDDIVKSFHEKKITTFRINSVKTGLPQLRDMLRRRRLRFAEYKYPPGAFALKTPLRQFQNTNIYKEGFVHVQNISSMLPVLALDPRDNDRILDLCAAPGAKTTHIASLAPKAKLIAIEKSRDRYYKLLANLKMQGIGWVKVLLLDSVWVRKKFPEHFNKILADMPCTTEGRFLLSNPRTYKYWKDQKVKEMVHKQKKLLGAAYLALETGGELVYSTCTFSPEENEGVIDWFLGRHKKDVELMPIEFPLDNVIDGITRWGDKKYCSAVRMTKRVIPDAAMEGFFIAKIKKLQA